MFNEYTPHRASIAISESKITEQIPNSHLLFVGVCGISHPQHFIVIMWSYLKSDLEELVSVVKEDTSIALEKYADDSEAKKHNAAVKEAVRRMSVEETFTVPLLATTTTAKNTASAAAAGIKESSSAAGSVASGNVSVDSATAASANDDEPVDSAEAMRVEVFLKSFDINERTDEISDFLGKHPDTLRKYFEDLVPEVVRYEDFWERFFYRCDENLIEREWAAEEERNRKARAELVGSVSNFFGVAAKAVASGVASALTEDDAGNPGRSKGSLQSIFGTSGRPPFVMNTAVDEDEDEEEQLGWDDEEEEEDEEYEEFSGIASSSAGGSAAHSRGLIEEQIEFKDEALEAVKDQLKQAMEERDILHQTVELQNKEIASLKGGNDSTSQLVEELRAKLKTTEMELFAVKQEIESEMATSTATDEQGVNWAAKVKHLTGLLSAKELQLSKMQGSFTANSKDLDESFALLKKENELLRQKLMQVASESTAQLKTLEDQVASSKNKALACEADLETIKSSLAASQKEAASLKFELERSKEELHLKEAPKLDEDAGSANKSLETHDTASTGVNVEKPAVVTKIVGGGDVGEEEGWGDDWD